MNNDNKPLFPLGQIVATPAALELLESHGMVPLTLITRHLSGDWGDLDADDKQANEDALKNGARIFSSYVVAPGKKAWVVTEADRASTCVLLPSDY